MPAGTLYHASAPDVQISLAATAGRLANRALSLPPQGRLQLLIETQAGDGPVALPRASRDRLSPRPADLVCITRRRQPVPAPLAQLQPDAAMAVIPCARRRPCLSPTS